MRFVKKVNERGVLTLPSEVREALDIQDGDIVEFEVLNVIKKGYKKQQASSQDAMARSTHGGADE